MHILPAIPREKTFFLALLALVVLGLSLSFLTWHNLRVQKIAVEQHMVLAARAISSGMEGGIGWRMRHMRGNGEEHGGSALPMFLEGMDSPEVLSFGIFTPDGHALLASGEIEHLAQIPEQAHTALTQKGQWHGIVALDNQQALLYVRHVRPRLARNFQHMHPLKPGQRPMDRRPVLVLALDIRDHLAMYQDARRAALWQTGYILGASTVLWLALITLLKQRRHGARVTELEFFQSQLLDNLPDGLLTLDSDGTICSANPAAMTILGRGTQLTGIQWNSLPLCGVTEKPDQLEGEIIWKQFTFENRFLEVLFVPLQKHCSFGNHILVMVRDRTQIKTLESSLQEAQRLAAVGRLAAAVAHEIRNPLSALRGFAQYFSSRLAGREPEQTYARTMVSEADRLNRVITDLLFLSKPRQPRLGQVQLDTLLDEISPLVQQEILSRNALILRDFAVPALRADPDLLKQALLNLMMNAVEALPQEGGTILVGSAREDSSRQEGASGKNGVTLFVQDNGRGMNADQQARAMEPFYTTREDGAGLGLPIVHKIVRDHGGEMEVSSSPSSGVTVKLFFPGWSATMPDTKHE